MTKSGLHFTRYECRCDCGTVKEVNANSLISGRSTSCGCRHREIASSVCRNNFKTHGETKSRLYQIYAGIKKRCNNPHSYNYKNYGARGIKICDEWAHSWDSFRDWSLKNGYSGSLSIDRIDVDGNYSPDNCRWVTRDVQANNRRSNRKLTYNEETHTCAEWARIIGVSGKSLYKMLKRGMTLSEIMAR